MNIYLLEQDVNADYDTYDSIIVTASNEAKARCVFEFCKYSWVKYEDRDKIKVTLIGKSKSNKSEVILSSFNAG